jgi:hypothetical protein
LLVGRQHGDRVAAVGLRLFAKPLDVWAHLLEPLPHAFARRGVGSLGTETARGPHGVGLRAKRAAALGGPPRDGRESGDLRIGELQLSSLRQKEGRRVVERTATGTRSHCSGAGLTASHSRYGRLGRDGRGGSGANQGGSED